MKKNLMIIGASGHGKVVADIAIKLNKWDTIEFLDLDPNKKECLGLKVSFDQNAYSMFSKSHDFFVAIGDNNTREKITNKLLLEGVTIVPLVHPSAIIGTNVQLEAGTVVMAGAIINSDSRIGKGCIINTNSNVDHDALIEDFVHISPGVSIAGTVNIGKYSWIGIGTSIIQEIKIGNNTIIGAGSVVVKDIPANCIAIGSPAKPIKIQAK